MFPSVSDAASYLSETRGISISAAKKRLSCGRINVKTRAKPGESFVKTKTYKAWSRIIHGVANPNSQEYLPEITVCERWKDFNNFYEDVGEPPRKDMAFVRIDKNKGFQPDNCTWGTKGQASKINADYMKMKGKLSIDQ